MTLSNVVIKMLQECDIKAEREQMIKDGTIEQIDTPFGTIEYIKHPLLRSRA